MPTPESPNPNDYEKHLAVIGTTPTEVHIAVIIAELASLGYDFDAVDKLILGRWPELTIKDVAFAWRTSGEGQMLAADALFHAPRLRVRRRLRAAEILADALRTVQEEMRGDPGAEAISRLIEERLAAAACAPDWPGSNSSNRPTNGE